MSRPTIGVLALQGDVREHLRTLALLEVTPLAVRRPGELAACDGLVLPGGESTTMVKLARAVGLFDPLRERIQAGLPVLGTCAGMILLADRVRDAAPGQETLGGLDMTVRRNAFGRQVDSHESDLDMVGLDAPVHAVFIRAPWVEEVGEGVEVLAQIPSGRGAGQAAGRVVAVRQGSLVATSFHPEVGGGTGVHRMFTELVRRTVSAQTS